MPTHPFISLELKEFLRSIGAWCKNRETKEEGPTLAGLLMFGKLRSIHDELPNYILDYQERPEAKTENRWIDRVTTDGSWSGNLYDFYRRVYQKITSDLKVPFKLEDGVRIDETSVHEGLREALVNALIHADYRGRVSILIVKRPDMFGFRNPGLMRIPIEQALESGRDNSDCRNRNLQKMFQLIGAGEQAGSGISKIYQSWEQQHWRRPLIIERPEPAQTIFELHMASLLSKETVQKLDSQFGDNFRSLPTLERIILATAISEESVDHKRIRTINPAHPADISKALHFLVKKGFLIQNGAGRGTTYCIKEVNKIHGLESNSTGLGINSTGLNASSTGLNASSTGLDVNSTCLDVESIMDNERKIAAPAQNSKKLSSSEMQSIIYALCSIRSQPLEKLSILLNRSQVYLRDNHINPMLSNHKLKMLYADTPNHPNQAYLSALP